jgi:predicted MPP superfamily phosphohydrolase
MSFKIAFMTFSFATALVPAAFLLPRLRLGRMLRVSLTLFLFVVSSQFLVNSLFGGSMFYPAWPLPLVITWGALNCALMVFFFLHLPCYLVLPWIPVRWRRIVVGLVAAFSAALTLVGVYECVKIPRVNEICLSLEGLPPEFDGYRIAQLSDIHCSQITPRSRFGEIVRRTNAAKPDLICLTGDYVDGWVSQLGDKLKPFSGFNAPDGVLAVPGNHEYYWGWREWRPFFEGLGFAVLENSWTNIVRGSASIVVGGIPDVVSSKPLKRGSGGAKERDGSADFRRPDHESVFSGAPRDSFRILLMHRPLSVRVAGGRCNVKLQLSGHTHGGGLPCLSWLVSRWNEGHVRGLYEEAGLKLYVSPGTGQWAGFPIRILNPSEITLFTLKRK